MIIFIEIDTQFWPYNENHIHFTERAATVLVTVDFYSYMLQVESMSFSRKPGNVGLFTINISTADLDKKNWIPFKHGYGFVSTPWREEPIKQFFVYGLHEFFHYYFQRVKDRDSDVLLQRQWSFFFYDRNHALINELFHFHLLDLKIELSEQFLIADIHRYVYQPITNTYSYPRIVRKKLPRPNQTPRSRNHNDKPIGDHRWLKPVPYEESDPAGWDTE